MTRDAVRRYLISYDNVDNRRRATVAKLLLRHGDRIQYSVFVVDAKPSRFIRLRRELIVTLRTREDSLLLCDLGALGQISQRDFEVIGKERPITDSGSFIV